MSVVMDVQRPRLDAEQMATLEPGKRVVVGDFDCRGLSGVDIARIVGTTTSVGFDVRMLGRALGINLELVQTNTRDKAGQLLRMRWEVVRRGHNAGSNPLG